MNIENCIYMNRHLKKRETVIEETRRNKKKKKQSTDNNAILSGRLVIQKERRADALALTAEEGRGKLRKAAGRCKRPTNRRYPNGATRIPKRYALVYE